MSVRLYALTAFLSIAALTSYGLMVAAHGRADADLLMLWAMALLFIGWLGQRATRLLHGRLRRFV